VSRGVDLGYQVIEEYMRQGQDFARAAWSSSPVGEALGADPRRLTERMFQYASDLASTWLEYTQMTMAGAPLGRPAPTPGQRRPEGAVGGFDIDGPPPSQPSPGTDGRQGAAALDAPVVALDIASKRRVQVTADLRPSAGRGTLMAHDLRAANPALPRIGGVKVAREDDGTLVVRVVIPDDCPAAIYSGLIVDEESNLPRGTLSVRVFD
jgi:hypothetical protein